MSIVVVILVAAFGGAMIGWGVAQFGFHRERLNHEHRGRVIDGLLGDEPKFREMFAKGGALHVLVDKHRAAELYAGAFWELFREHPEAKNFIEMTMKDRFGHTLLLTLQRPDGKTPATLVAELKGVLENLRTKARDHELSGRDVEVMVGEALK